MKILGAHVRRSGRDRSTISTELDKFASEERAMTPRGCAKVTHGLFGTPEYNAWVGAKMRCRNPKASKYHMYGGSGITFSVAFDRFEDFIAYMGRKPSPRHSLDRIDGTRWYEPGNVRWATHEEQNANRRTSRRLTSSGECLSELARNHGLNPETLRSRLRAGMSVHDALHTPLMKVATRRPREARK